MRWTTTPGTITSAFNGLYAGLAEKRILYLQREQSPGRKGAIYEFPREIRRIRVPWNREDA